MSLNNGKHTIAVIEGVRCTLVETGISESRMHFLRSLLEFNSYQVKTEKDEPGNYKIGVTNLLFNPVIDVYKRHLKTPTGHIVTPSYWLQLTTAETEKEVNYWIR
jgi:hypothetical protein